MRVSRHLLILTLLAAALCSDRDAAQASVPDQPQMTASHGLIRRLSAQLRAAIAVKKLPADRFLTGMVSVEPIAMPTTVQAANTLQSWLVNLPPPATV